MATSSGNTNSVRTIAIVAAVIAALSLGTTLYTLASHATTTTASQGASGPPGPPGPPGPNGTNGANGTSGAPRTWASFAPTFVKNGTLSNVSTSVTPCFTPGAGAYECNVTFGITGTKDLEFQGVNYSASSGFYFVGADPSTDWLMDEGQNYTFQLWFQVIAPDGALTPTVTLHLGELSRS